MEKLDWLGKPYYSLNAYMRHTFGEKVYKIAVDAGLTCPNRDGTCGDRGCIFCSQGGSGDFAVPLCEEVYHREYAGKESDSRRALNVKRQIERGVARFTKSVGERFVIYFQAYTNTYGDLAYLEKIWRDALAHEAVVGISIATRPDCLGETVMALLCSLHEEYSKAGKFIWVELGLQTIHQETADYIRRGYLLSAYDEAVRALGRAEIPYITHVILGLPKETEAMMKETVSYVVNHELPPQGIKLQLLHVLAGTDLAGEYEAGRILTLSMEEYIALVIDCLRMIPPEIVIHRLTGDGPKRILLAPKWSGNKKAVLNALHRRMREENVVQGCGLGLEKS